MHLSLWEDLFVEFFYPLLYVMLTCPWLEERQVLAKLANNCLYHIIINMINLFEKLRKVNMKMLC